MGDGPQSRTYFQYGQPGSSSGEDRPEETPEETPEKGLEKMPEGAPEEATKPAAADILEAPADASDVLADSLAGNLPGGMPPGFTRALRPLLLGPGVILASIFTVFDQGSSLGSALEAVTAQGTWVLMCLIGWLITALPLLLISSLRKGKRFALTPVMALSTGLLLLSPLLTYLFIRSGVHFEGSVPGSAFLMLCAGGLCAGAGFTCVFNAWNTCTYAMNFLLGLLYIILGLVLAVVLAVVLHGLAVTALSATLLNMALVFLGAALLHIQVRILDQKE